MQRQGMTGARATRFCSILALTIPAVLGLAVSPSAATEKEVGRLLKRGDIKQLPDPLKARLAQLIELPHAFPAVPAFNEAANPSRLFQYYLLDQTSFQPNVFTAQIPGINDTATPPADSALGAIRVVVEPKPGLPTDPNDVHAAIDTFADFAGLNVINNESGWYENWMIHDLVVAKVADPVGGRAQFGTITAADAAALKSMGDGANVPNNFFTTDGKPPRFPSATDHFPDNQSNLVWFAVSVGTFNGLQVNDAHAYWEFNPGTDWVFPAYELPFTGVGFPGPFKDVPPGGFSSVVPGPGPDGPQNDPATFGDNADNPRDPDRNAATDPAQNETRLRFIPSGLANEVFLDAFERVKSFEPGVTDPSQRLFDAYATEVERVAPSGVVSFQEAAVDGTSDGLPNTRLYLPATAFDRFAVTREINDGMLAPRFAPSQRAFLLSGNLIPVSPAVPASFVESDGDNDADDGGN
jgi:hypothetical protein